MLPPSPFLLLLALSSLSPPASSGVPHSHQHEHAKGREREGDGAFSPRDRAHKPGGDQHDSSFDHEAILGSAKDAEEFDELPPEEAKDKLEKLLERMDRNLDKKVGGWVGGPLSGATPFFCPYFLPNVVCKLMLCHGMYYVHTGTYK